MNIQLLEVMAVGGVFEHDYEEFWRKHMDLRQEILSWRGTGNLDEILDTPESAHVLGIYALENAVLEWLDLMEANGVIIQKERNGNVFYGLKDDDRAYMHPVATYAGWLYENTLTAAVAVAQGDERDYREIFFTMVEKIVLREDGSLQNETVRCMTEALIEASRKLVSGELKAPNIH